MFLQGRLGRFSYVYTTLIPMQWRNANTLTAFIRSFPRSSYEASRNIFSPFCPIFLLSFLLFRFMTHNSLRFSLSCNERTHFSVHTREQTIRACAQWEKCVTSFFRSLSVSWCYLWREEGPLQLCTLELWLWLRFCMECAQSACLPWTSIICMSWNMKLAIWLTIPALARIVLLETQKKSFHCCCELETTHSSSTSTTCWPVS